MAEDKTTVEQVEMVIEDLVSENVLLAAKTNPLLDKLKNNQSDGSMFFKEEEPKIIEEVKKIKEEVKKDEPKMEVVEEELTPTTFNLGTLINKLVESKQLFPFKDDEKKFEEYTEEDFLELYTANLAAKEEELQKQIPNIQSSYYENLPDEFKIAGEYFNKGGTDVKGILKYLSQAVETRELDVKDVKDQEEIALQYLRGIQFGTEDEIQDEINTYKDASKLEAKANQFKPKLDGMQESIVARKLADQELKNKQQAAAAQQYATNIFETLKPGELNGLKLDKKTQDLLYTGLVRANYPSINGKQTNLLGHLLEQHQIVKPNHALVAEALWLLSDPEGYKNQLKTLGSNKQVEKTVKLLKTEQSSKIASGSTADPNENVSRVKTISKPKSNIFNTLGAR